MCISLAGGARLRNPPVSQVLACGVSSTTSHWREARLEEVFARFTKDPTLQACYEYAFGRNLGRIIVSYSNALHRTVRSVRYPPGKRKG